MIILINCSNIKIGGGLQVAHSFLYEIAKNEQDVFVIVLSSKLNKQIDKRIFKENHIFSNYNIEASPFNTIFSNNIFLDKLVKNHEIEKVFTLFGPCYWRPKVQHICGYAKAHYIYEKSPFFKTISLKEKIRLKIKEFFHLLDFKKNTDILITENPDISEKLARKLTKRVFTVTNTYNQIFDNNEKWKIYDLPKFEGKYLLTVSANYPHKNLQVIPLVIKEFLKRNITQFKFVVTLQKGDIMSNPELDKYIEYIGKVEITECPSLYEQTHYMFLPTLLECFSASYAEAMKMDKIILTSNLGFAKGICKDAAIYFDPLSPKDIVDKIEEIDKDFQLQSIIIDKGRQRLSEFDNYKRRAEKYLEIIKKS